jgi:predicted short-subunit dehydrogenase-like oxidoreductase (DUF2520 family)
MISDKVSLNSLTFSLVGPGNVGSSLAHWLVSSGGHLSKVASRRPDSARRLADTLGGYPISLSRMTSIEDDLLLVAVSDPALQDVTLALTARKQAPVVLHTSGRATGEVLAPLRHHGSAIGSLHPLKAFREVLVDPSEAVGTVFGIDGDDRAQSLACRLASAFSGVTTVIPPAARSRYHAAATMAAGGVVTLLASAAELAQTAGLGPEVVTGYLELARGALRIAESSDPIASAITGPISRGDMTGYQSQINEIREWDPELADFLEVLAQRTLHHCQNLESSR